MHARLAALMTLTAVCAWAQAPAGAARPQRQFTGFSVGPADQHKVDPAGADRGKKVYAAECITCHGTQGRGSERGADLIRSAVVLKDRYGSEIGAFLKKGHPTQTTPAAKLTDEQIGDLAHWAHQRKLETLRHTQEVGDVLTGDAKAGAAYFNGAGKCSTCHSATGDFKGIGKRYDPPALQQRFLFPRTVGFGRRTVTGGRPNKPVMVTVTAAGAAPVTGTLVHLDDFNVSLRDSSGEYVSYKRTAQLKVVKDDPYQFHIDQLDKYTDQNMHDIVAYLESLR